MYISGQNNKYLGIRHYFTYTHSMLGTGMSNSAEVLGCCKLFYLLVKPQETLTIGFVNWSILMQISCVYIYIYIYIYFKYIFIYFENFCIFFRYFFNKPCLVFHELSSSHSLINVPKLYCIFIIFISLSNLSFIVAV